MRSFRDFMESALYDAERGYYCVREKTADFYTAPELHRAFGCVLADRLARFLEQVAAEDLSAPLSLVEAGCGDGTLACQVARRLQEHHASVTSRVRFVLVERGRKDLTTAISRLTAFGLPVEGYTDISQVPAFKGVLYSNELLDSLAVHLLQKHHGKVLEVFIDNAGREVCAELSLPELRAPAAALENTLQEGERHAVNLAAPRWIHSAAGVLKAGYVVSVDYGKRFAPGDVNPPRAFRSHSASSYVTREPGSQDLTASVDFEAIIAAGYEAQLTVDSYGTLSKFLIDGGIGAWIEHAEGPGPSDYRERAQIKTLIHPEGMGEIFKVLVQRKAR
ncbi:MAG: SAM-dependent methyltransferase [Elusimicrobiota bacterium]